MADADALYGVPVRPRFSALTRRIIFFNAFALVVFVTGVFWVQSNRSGLVNERIAGIQDQALIVAGALAEYTAVAEDRSIDLNTAEPLLRQLITPTRLRARIYSNKGTLLTDSRFLLARNVVTTEELPPASSSNRVIAFFQQVGTEIHNFYDGLLGIRPLAQIEPYFEGGKDGRVYHEVVNAMTGDTANAVRVNEQNRLVISVAVPIRRFGTHYGVLMLTTESGDIDAILKGERLALIQVSLFAVVALLLSSLYLASFIAEPIRTLAAAAERVRRGRSGHETIPTFSERQDEIGELSDSLAAMTRALYDRIDAIESFAADVAHELKNPLTSLRSAVEMLERTPPGEQRERLVAVIRNDVKRIDRLITDISDASRLDAELSRAQTETLDLAKLLETIADIYNGMELKRGVKVDFVRAGDGPAKVQGLDDRLGQVFRNLIDNAVSFSPENGRVRVTVTPGEREVRASIEDEGPGIPPDDVEKIFNRFYTERPPEHGFGRNSGLGLAIARQIVESHDGRIWAENKETHGARFTVLLPRSLRA